MGYVSLDGLRSTSTQQPQSFPIETVNKRIGQVYAHTAGALAISSLSAAAFTKIGFAATLLSSMITNPFITTLGLVAIGTSLIAATIFTPNENSLLKHGSYGLFAVAQGLILSPLVLVNSGAFATATAATVVLIGGLGALAMNLRESFEKYETILMVALGALTLVSFCSLFFSSVAGITHQISYMGGFALFGAFVIYDTHVARKEAGNDPHFDVIKHSLSIYLDAINLLSRLWEKFDKTKVL